jgi:hypothetical protein
MSGKKQKEGLVTTLATGMRDIPRNASWLVGKALATGSPPPANGSGVVAAAKSAGRSVKDALPGGDSVDARLSRARSAAAEARAAEEAAVEAAQRTHELVVGADQVAEDEDRHMAKVESEQSARVDARVAEARRKADEQVAAERRRAEKEAADAVAKERADSEKRSARARAAAEEAQQEAEKRYEEAGKRLAEARELADQAAVAAREAAEEARAEADRIAEDAQRDAQEARAEADRIAGDAQRDADGAEQAVADAAALREDTARVAVAVTRAVNDKKTPGRLEDLTKADLVRLATAEGVAGRSSMTKKELVTVLNKKSAAAGRGKK